MVQRLVELIDNETVLAALRPAAEDDEESIARVVLALSGAAEVTWMQHLARDLAADGYPTLRWEQPARWPPSVPELLGVVVEDVGGGLEAASQRVRLAFQERLPGNDGRVQRVLGPQLEALLEATEGGGAADQRVLEAILRLDPGPEPSALIVTDAAFRRRTRTLLRQAGLSTPVLTSAEATVPP